MNFKYAKKKEEKGKTRKCNNSNCKIVKFAKFANESLSFAHFIFFADGHRDEA